MFVVLKRMMQMTHQPLFRLRKRSHRHYLQLDDKVTKVGSSWILVTGELSHFDPFVPLTPGRSQDVFDAVLFNVVVGERNGFLVSIMRNYCVEPKAG